MIQVDIQHARTQLSRLVDQAAAGEEIVIARGGRPVARLVALEPRREPRRLGQFDGAPFWMAPDFDELPADMQAAFEGEDE